MIRWAMFRSAATISSIRPSSSSTHLGLVQVEVDRAEAAAPRVQDLEELAHPLEERHERLRSAAVAAGSRR